MWKCSKCEAMVEDNEKVCPVCGEAYPEDEVVEDVTPAASEETEEIIEETEEIAEDVISEEAEEIAEDDFEESEDVVTFDEPLTWTCATCGAECDGDVCPACGQLKPEELIVDFVPKKNNKIVGFVVAVAVIVAITIGIFAYFFLNRYVDRTGEKNAITYTDIENSIDSIFGDETVLKVNGIEVPRDIFESYLTNNALYYQQNFCYNEYGQFDETKLKNFKWTDVADDGSGQTHRQKVLTETINNCVEIYSVLSMGKKHNVTPSQVDLEKIDDQIDEYKAQYGDQFQTILELNGYSHVDQFKAILTLDTEMTAVYTDIEANPDRYIGEDLSIYNVENPETVSVKHILIKVDEENGVDDKAAKKKANSVLKKAQKGDDFDKLIKEYNEDEAQPAEGYTVQKGQMSEEFEKASFALKVDELSGLVKTKNGYHIIKRIVTASDALAYTIENSKALINKSLLDDIKIKADLGKIYEEQKAQQAAAEEAEAEGENEEVVAEG